MVWYGMISIELYIPSMTDKEESRAEQRRADGMILIEPYIPSMTNIEESRGEERRWYGMI